MARFYELTLMFISRPGGSQYVQYRDGEGETWFACRVNVAAVRWSLKSKLLSLF